MYRPEPSPPATSPFDIDHTSFAVHDVTGWAQRLRRELGATPVIGEVLTDFRYLLLYIGTQEKGARLELMDPRGSGFLTRYLSKHGEGPHHITFSVPDLKSAVERVRSLGLTVVGESYEHSPWREAFILPEGTHGVLIQLAQSDRAYPDAAELLSTQARDTATLPSALGATEQLWWSWLWETSPGTEVELGRTHVASCDLVLSRKLFGDALEGSVSEGPEYTEFAWPSGSVRVRSADKPGVLGMDLPSGADGMSIGSAWLGRGD